MVEPNAEPDDLDPVEDLLAECLAQPENERAASIARICRECPQHASELRERLQVLAAIGIDVTSERMPFPERLGDFRLKRPLGKGGMGIVYLAEQESLGREVALKLIRPENLYFPGARERFQREVQTAARLSHAGIVPVYCVGEADGIPYFAMERIVGCSLDDVLRELQGGEAHALTGDDMRRAVISCTRRHHETQTPLPQAHPLFAGSWVQSCVRICQVVSATLDYAHARGVLHRDIKPSNVLVTPEGRVTVVDFGLASLEGTSKLTLTGSQVGSLPYMAPEQLKGEARSIDARTDVYALGITLYELLALSLPYRADSHESTRRSILEARPRPLREHNAAVPWDVETVCLKAMACERERRYQSAAQLAADLGNALALQPITARRPGPALRTRRWMQRHPTKSVALVLGFLGLVLLPALAWLRIRAEREESARSRTQLESKQGQMQVLADLDLARRLIAIEPELWPATADRVAAMEAWLRSAHEIEARLPDHASSIEGSEASSTLGAEVLHDMTQTAARVRELTPPVQWRRDMAATLDARTVTGAEAKALWQRAIDDIVTSEAYGGLEVQPVRGFLPLEPDPDSGLWEFWHVMSGARPSRHTSHGRWRIGEDTGMVFVLMPASTLEMGLAVVGRDADEGPAHRVTLAPFLIGKYEMTQGQWLRLAGTNPATVVKGSAEDVDAVASLANPVETVSWFDCDTMLGRFELALPTESQWECACRAGTSTSFFFGEQLFALRKYANVASREFTRESGTPAEDWNDGFAGPAPVGSFEPNPFGLHDVLGNVSEWCRDWWQRYGVNAPRAGDGLRDHNPLAYRVQRGGSFMLKSLWARSVARAYEAPHLKAPGMGVRAVKDLP